MLVQFLSQGVQIVRRLFQMASKIRAACGTKARTLSFMFGTVPHANAYTNKHGRVDKFSLQGLQQHRLQARWAC